MFQGGVFVQCFRVEAVFLRGWEVESLCLKSKALHCFCSAGISKTVGKDRLRTSEG